MGIYVAKPVEVDALFFDGNNISEVQHMCGHHESYNHHFVLETFNKLGTYFVSEDPSHEAELWVEAGRCWIGVPRQVWIVKTVMGCLMLTPKEFRTHYTMKTYTS